MSLTRLLAPAAGPVDLALLLDHLKRDPEDDDAHIQHCLEVATAQFDGPDGELGRALVLQTWRESFAVVPSGTGRVELDLSPVSTLVKVEVYVAGGDWQAVALEAVDLIEDGGRAYVRSSDWPRPMPGYPEPLRITYVAGFGAAVDVPAPIRHAILLLAAHLYQAREPVVFGETPIEVPLSIERLVGRYKVWWR